MTSPIGKHPAYDESAGALLCPMCRDPFSSFLDYNKHVQGHDRPAHLATTQLAGAPVEEPAEPSIPVLTTADRRRAAFIGGALATITAMVIVDMARLPEPASLTPAVAYVLVVGVTWARRRWTTRTARRAPRVRRRVWRRSPTAPV